MRRLVLDQGLMGVGRAAAHCSWLGALNVPDVRFLAHCPTGAQLSADGWEATKERAGNLWSGANDLAKSGWEGAKETAGAVSNTAGAVWGGVKQGASEAWSGAKGAAQSGWDWLKKKVGG